MATLKDVAKLSGVTVTTISRMLNHRGNVSEKTRTRIEEAMRQLNYQPNEVARSLIKQKSNFIGLIVPSARNFFFGAMIDSIEHYVSQRGHKLLLCISDLSEKKEQEYFNMLRGNKVEGVILSSSTVDIQQHIPFDSPLISIDCILSPLIPAACVDNYSGGRMAAEHLLERGCQKTVFLDGSATIDMDTNKRYTGFRDVFREREAKEPLTFHATERDFLSMRYDNMIQTLFEQHPDIDGVFASNDIIAAQVVQYCTDHGISVPQQIRVIGCDDVDIAELISPRLTTLRQPLDAICRYAVDSIIAAADGQTIPSTAIFPSQLVIREST